MCTGMARFSQQRQSWTRQPTNVKVSKVINFISLIRAAQLEKDVYLTLKLNPLPVLKHISSLRIYVQRLIVLLELQSNCCFQLTTPVFLHVALHFMLYLYDCTLVRYGNIPCYFRFLNEFPYLPGSSWFSFITIVHENPFAAN